MDINILYEDNHLIAVYKPAGVLVQAGLNPRLKNRGSADQSLKTIDLGGHPYHDDNTLYWQVKEFIRKRDQKPGNVFLGVLHRLDRVVSGIVLFAKTSKGAARLSEQIRNREVKKIYHAVVIGEMDPKSATLKNFLQKDETALKAVVGEAGDESILHYETVQSNGKYSLLKIELETGRFHQIRAQLAAVGHPIVGDTKYLPAGRQAAHFPLPDKSIMLCATELTFVTATSDELQTISIEIPGDWQALYKA